MTATAGFIEAIAEYDALPVLLAVGAIAVVTKAVPTAGDAKAVILLRSGERVAVATEYDAVVARIAQSVGAD